MANFEKMSYNQQKSYFYSLEKNSKKLSATWNYEIYYQTARYSKKISGKTWW